MIFKVEKNKNYTVLSNYHLKEKRMSLKAKGLLSIILSLPEEWNYSQQGLVELSSDEIYTVRNALSELKKFGYVKVIKKKPNETASGRFEYEYIVFEQPQLENIEENKEINDVASMFNKLWERYPRKESEKDARTYFKKLNPNEELFEQIIEGVNKLRRSKRSSDVKYIPLLVNWLKQEKWNDVYKESELSSFDIEDWEKEKGIDW